MAGQPNILVILSDQLRRDALSCYGDPNIRTEHMDALADAGVRFNQSCSTYPVCVPYRFSFMTGEYAHTRFVPGIEWRMSPTERTLADAFNDGGYDTIYVGKWHLYGGHGWLPDHPNKKVRYTPVPRQHQGRWKKWLAFEVCNAPWDSIYYEDGDPTPRKIEGYQTDGLFDLTMNHLEHGWSGDKPFMCVLSVEPPHFPLSAPKELEDKWLKKELKLKPSFYEPVDYEMPLGAYGLEDREKTLRNHQIYYAMIENLDQNVGRMTEFLKRTGLWDNTVVMLIADHGQMDGSHALRSTTKEYPFEESIGVPLIVRDPRHTERAGSTINEPTCTEDLFPTLLGLAGLPAENNPGENLAPLAHGEQDKLDREGVLLEYVHDIRPQIAFHGVYYRGFRTKRYKYTVLGPAAGGKPWQLFDLEADPYEMHNLVNEPTHRDLATRMHKLLRDKLVETGDHFVLAPAFGMEGLNTWPQD